ncbi:MAG TPA: LysR substrate-binding domain-containing protein [Noviherbaspirillum sp.]
MRKLPPLNALKAFEASARLVSFTRAAHELSVTQGAVSRQVAALEDWFGVALFQRSNSQLVLTEAGSKLCEEVTAALDRIALAVSGLQQQADLTQLAVSAPPTLTLRWLIPRLSSFQRAHPGTTVKLAASLQPLDFTGEKSGIILRAGHTPIAGMPAVSFLVEKLVPVCHPDLLERCPLRSPADLCRYKLLSYATEALSWSEWLHKVEAPPIVPVAALGFEQMYFALQAALEGLGIALIPYFLVADDIAAGKLCAPFGPFGAHERHYYAYRNPAQPAAPVQDAFLDWLIEQGRETMQLCDQLMAAESG